MKSAPLLAPARAILRRGRAKSAAARFARPLKRVPIRSVVTVSDQHVGCKLGLVHPDGAPLDDGGKYTPSAIQRAVHAWWEEFWGDFVPKATQGEPYIVVNNGDVIDGVHHGSTTQWAHNLADQRRAAERLLVPVVAACDGRYYHIRGTEAHVGKSGTEEEELARDIGAIRNPVGQHARWELWLNLQGHLIHWLHHIGTTSSSAHEVSAVNAELSAILVEAARWGEDRPSVVIRSHRHRCSEVRIPNETDWLSAIVTPAWQLKTPFTYKIAGARLSPPQIGGIVTRVHETTGEIYNRAWVRSVKRSGVVQT